MDLVKKYGYIVLIFVCVMILVILKSTGKGHFRYDAKKLAEQSVSGSNIITPESLSILKGNKLIIYLGNGIQKISGIDCKEISIRADSILTKKYTSLLSRNKGAVILCSEDYSISSKVWMILSQEGFKNIYIYSAEPGIEILKKEIRPDTLTRPE
jgi:hypothetical protein